VTVAPGMTGRPRCAPDHASTVTRTRLCPVIVTGALLEIPLAARVDYASYVYLLFIAAGLMRRDQTVSPAVGARRAPRGRGN